MADGPDESQQTEEPTSHKLQQAQEHGDTVSSSEVNTLILLLGATLAIAVFARSAGHQLAALFRIFIASPDEINVDPGALQGLMAHVLVQLLLILGPVFGLLMVSALAANFVQHPLTFSTEHIKPDLSKLNPMNGFKRLFGSDGLVNVLKGLIKIAIIGAAVWTQIWPERNTLEAVLWQSPPDIASDMVRLAIKVLSATLAAMAVIAGADFLFKRFQFMKRNRMTKQEVKDEFKQTEGDPQIKGRIRQLRMEKARRRMIAAVPDATVVITNPTHYAVALKYEADKKMAPVCVAKGVDALALRIRDKAKEAEVPVVENPPLARALYASVEVDDPIPVEHYKAVAQVIGYVMKLTGKTKPN